MTDVNDSAMDKARESLDTMPGQKHVVVCNKCGSTGVGLRGVDPPDELLCESCGNVMSWDGRKFLILQYKDNKPELNTVVGIKRAVQRSEEEAEERSADQDNS